jgi:hypothetical protein
MNPAPLTWYFPLNRPHTGVPLGNGVQGLLIWGESSLFLTVARLGFWDRRGGRGIEPGTTFTAVRAALEKGDDAALHALFPKRGPGEPFPQQMGGGRLEIIFPEGLRPISATLNISTAEAEVRVGRHEDDADCHVLRVRQSAEGEVSWLEADADFLATLTLRLHAAFETVHQNAMGALGIAAPMKWTDANGGGFVQTLPSDPALAVAWQREGSRVVLATALGTEVEQAVRTRLRDFDPAAEDAARTAFWTRYWATAARVTVPDETIQGQFDFGLYRQAGLIRRQAPAATLQGSWMEDTVIPAWSNDYHFNINVQLVYSAALPTGQAEEMAPLWKMLRDWLPRFRELGEAFYQTPGAMLLPHAVDDHCQMMGTFWAGTIDQACIAWMALVAYQYYEFTGDVAFLRELVWPLLEGGFLGYYAMLDRTVDADGRARLSLPVSVSPEFGGAEPSECWGRDASFQIAALHATVRMLRSSASILGIAEDPRWADVADHLPPYTLADASHGASYTWIGEPAQRVALWEGKDLPESHRHHAHLAGIFPFCTIDPFDPVHQKIVARSLSRWATLGAGNWTGWSMPWAANLASRCGLPESARSYLHLMTEAFTNEGHATLHNADSAGMFGWDDGSLQWPDHRKGADYKYYEIMQMDAAMGALSAIIEMLVSYRNGVIHITDRLPKGWREVSFTGVRIEGGFELEANFRHGRADELTIVSSRGGELRLEHALGDSWTLNGDVKTGTRLIVATQAGETLQLRRAAGC